MAPKDVANFIFPIKGFNNGDAIVGYHPVSGVLPPPINVGLTASGLEDKYTNRFEEPREKVADLDSFNLNIRFGEYPRYSTNAIIAQSESVGTGFQNIAGAISTIYYPSSGVTLGVSSTDPDDNSTGNGARSIRIEGLDENYVEQLEFINMSGTGVVSTTKKYFRVNSALTFSAGSSQHNEGDIYIADATDTFSTGVPTQPFFGINRTWGFGECGIFTVPSGSEMVLTYMHTSSDPDKPVDLRVELMRRGSNAWNRPIQAIGQGGLAELRPIGSIVLSVGHEIRIMGRVAAGVGEAQANLIYVLKDIC